METSKKDRRKKNARKNVNRNVQYIPNSDMVGECACVRAPRHTSETNHTVMVDVAACMGMR